MEFKRDEYTKDFNDLSYRRVWTRPITTYAENYNRFDISLAPLKHHTFNRVKSQLKVIEAGFHKKALIAQNYGPYQIDCVNAMERGGTINENGNALLVDKIKNHKLWGKYTKLLINNADLREQLGENLYRDVQPYHIKNVTAKRAEIYKELVRQKNK
jgi:glycosyltransferase involved in cell wall biosynthesis